MLGENPYLRRRRQEREDEKRAALEAERKEKEEREERREHAQLMERHRLAHQSFCDMCGSNDTDGIRKLSSKYQYIAFNALSHQCPPPSNLRHFRHNWTALHTCCWDKNCCAALRLVLKLNREMPPVPEKIQTKSSTERKSAIHKDILNEQRHNAHEKAAVEKDYWRDRWDAQHNDAGHRRIKRLIHIKSYKNKDTALRLAAERGRLKCAATLIAAGADINIQNVHGVTALASACRVGNPDIVALLLSEGAKGADPQDGLVYRDKRDGSMAIDECRSVNPYDDYNQLRLKGDCEKLLLGQRAVDLYPIVGALREGIFDINNYSDAWKSVQTRDQLMKSMVESPDGKGKEDGSGSLESKEE